MVGVRTGTPTEIKVGTGAVEIVQEDGVGTGTVQEGVPQGKVSLPISAIIVVKAVLVIGVSP